MVKPMPHLTNRFLLLETSTVGSKKRYVKPSVTSWWAKNQESHSPRILQSTSQPDPSPHTFNNTSEEEQLPLQIHTIVRNMQVLISTFIDSGATGQFIDIDYVWSKNLHTQHLPRATPVYNMDGTLNEAGLWWAAQSVSTFLANPKAFTHLFWYINAMQCFRHLSDGMQWTLTHPPPQQKFPIHFPHPHQPLEGTPLPALLLKPMKWTETKIDTEWKWVQLLNVMSDMGWIPIDKNHE